MDRLPIETWQAVFGYACTDDGRTGRALSRVCKYFRETSRPVRFQSLKLVGAPQRRAFAKIIAQDPDIRVRYLFVSDGRLYAPGYFPEVPEDEESITLGPEPVRGTLRQQWHTFIQEILHTVESTLEVLFLDFDGSMTAFDSSAYRMASHLRALRDLRMYATYDSQLYLVGACLLPLRNVLDLSPNEPYDISISYGSPVTTSVDMQDVTRLYEDDHPAIGLANGQTILIDDVLSRLLPPLDEPPQSQSPRTSFDIYTHVLLKRSRSVFVFKQFPFPTIPWWVDAPPHAVEALTDFRKAAVENWLAAVARGSSRVTTVDLQHVKRYVADASFVDPPADVGAA